MLAGRLRAQRRLGQDDRALYGFRDERDIHVVSLPAEIVDHALSNDCGGEEESAGDR